MRDELKIVLICLSILAVSLGNQVKAQGIYTDVDVQQWPVGTVFLATGDSIRGEITFHCKEDIINVLKEDGTISSLSPVNVQYFIAYNTKTGTQQVFRTLYWNQGKENSEFKKPTFFELLNTGKLTLIMREIYSVRNSSGLGEYEQNDRIYNVNTTPDSYFAEEIRPLYYVLLPDGEIKTIKNIRKDLMKLFGNKADQIKKYARKYKLSYEKPNELVAIVNYYNTL